jgi:hypothetical protein
VKEETKQGADVKEENKGGHQFPGSKRNTPSKHAATTLGFKSMRSENQNNLVKFAQNNLGLP